MNVNVNVNFSTGSMVALATTAVSGVLAIITAFHLLPLTPTESAAILALTTFGAGAGLYVFAWLHTWKTDNYNVGQVTTALTTLVSLVLSLLSAFGVYRADSVRQTALTSAAGALALLGAFVFSALHTNQVVMVQRMARLRAMGLVYDHEGRAVADYEEHRVV